MQNLDQGLALVRQTQTLSRRHKQGLQQISSPPCFLSQPWEKLLIHIIIMSVFVILSEQE